MYYLILEQAPNDTRIVGLFNSQSNAIKIARELYTNNKNSPMISSIHTLINYEVYRLNPSVVLTQEIAPIYTTEGDELPW